MADDDGKLLFEGWWIKFICNDVNTNNIIFVESKITEEVQPTQSVIYENNVLPSETTLTNIRDSHAIINKQSLQKHPKQNDTLIVDYDYYEDPAFKTITNNLKEKNTMNKNQFFVTDDDLVKAQVNTQEDVNQNKYNKILVYNDNSHMSFIIDNPNKYDLQLLESNICGYKKYFEFENNEIDSNINITLISLFHEKYFDDEKSLIDKINSFKELFNIDDTLKRDVKTFISCNYNITNIINDKMKATDLFNEIYKFLKIEEKINIRNKLTNFLLDIGLKKKRYNDGIYYYGLQKIK